MTSPRILSKDEREIIFNNNAELVSGGSLTNSSTTDFQNTTLVENADDDDPGSSTKLLDRLATEHNDGSLTPESNKVRNNRTILTAEQQNLLEHEFEEKGLYISPRRAVELANKLNLQKQNVLIWYRNRRRRLGAQRKKWVPSAAQLAELEQEYELSKMYHLDKARRQMVADRFGVEDKCLAEWFAMRQAEDVARDSENAAAADQFTFSLPDSSTDCNNAAGSITSLMSSLDENTVMHYKHLTKSFCPDLYGELGGIDDHPLNRASQGYDLPGKPSKRRRLHESSESELDDANPHKDELVAKAESAADQPIDYSMNPKKRKRLSICLQRVDFPMANTEDAPLQVHMISNSPIISGDISNAQLTSFNNHQTFDAEYDTSEHYCGNDCSPSGLMMSKQVDDDNLSESYTPKKQNKKPMLLTCEQNLKLQEAFSKSPKINKKRASELADELDIPMSRVENWFRKHRVEQNVKINRSVLATEARDRLEKEYTENPILDKPRKKSLADELGINEKAVYAWFYRRNKKQEVATVEQEPEEVVELLMEP
ncbi:uncharacterized protein LOC106642080 [Copidosoma floridanum]|uniref:uncharacterized protein LOC106642080 n=1 Tax=Copidosoma floridanum TaxID=29053 RepID=UPI0006C98274|nr:uncharacterized protein LOC106642080 [Copidosoma floridanum]